MQKKKEINIQMGSRIRKARLQAGLTQEAFAELLHLSPSISPPLSEVSSGFPWKPFRYICQVLHVSAGHPSFWGYRKISGRYPLPAAWAAFPRGILPKWKKSSTKYWKFSQKNNRKRKFSFGFLFSNRNKKDRILFRLIFYQNPCICCCHCQPCVTSFRSSIQQLRHTRS